MITVREFISKDSGLDIFLGLLVLGSIATSIAYRTDLFNILLILTVCFIWLKSILRKDNIAVSLVVKIWAVTLIIYAVIWLYSLYNTIGSSASDYEKPAKILVCAFLAYQLAKQRIRWGFLSHGMALCVFLAVIFAIGHKYYRLEYGMNAGTAAYLLLIPVLFCLTNLVFNRDVGRVEFAFSFFAVIAGLWALTETQTRGVLVVLFCYFLLVIVFRVKTGKEQRWRVSNKGNLRKSSISVAVAVAVAVAFFLSAELQGSFSKAVQKIDSRIWQASREISRIQDGDEFYGSIGTRIALLHVGVKALQSPTILGEGENSLANLSGYISSMENPERYEFLKRNIHFHNQFLDLYTKRGVLGFLAFLAYLFAPLLFANSLQRLYLLSAILPLAVGGMIETPFNSSNFVTFYPLYVTFILVAVRPRSAESQFSRPATL